MKKYLDQISRISKLVHKEYMTPERCYDIAAIWMRLKPKRIVEIGTYAGTGACYLGAMAEISGGHVTTIDLPWTAQHNEKLPVIVEEQLEKCEIKNVTVIRREDGAEGWFKEFFINKEEPLDFVFVDGGHTWIHVAAQFVMTLAAVRQGGWICFDDLKNKKWPDIDVVWRQIVLPLCDHRFETDSKLGFVRRSKKW